MVDLKPMPLSLTDAQLTSLLEIAEQLHVLDRDAFLRAVADRFAGKSEIGEGEFARALTSAFGGGRAEAPRQKPAGHAPTPRDRRTSLWHAEDENGSDALLDEAPAEGRYRNGAARARL